MKEQIPEKIVFQGIIRSVQPRSNVWRYRLDNRTHFEWLTQQKSFGTINPSEITFTHEIPKNIDYSKLPKLKISAHNTYYVLKIGFCDEKMTQPFVSILKNGVESSYRLPLELCSWAKTLLLTEDQHLLPEKVTFSRINGQYYADLWI